MGSKWMAGAAGAALAVVVIALLGAGTAFSGPRHRGCHGHGGPSARLDRLEAKLSELTLDVETRAAAARLLEQARESGKARREEMREARRAMHELLESDAPALEDVMAQADALGALETEAHKAKLRDMLELRALVGPETWEQLRSSLKHRRHVEHEEKS